MHLHCTKLPHFHEPCLRVPPQPQLPHRHNSLVVYYCERVQTLILSQPCNGMQQCGGGAHGQNHRYARLQLPCSSFLHLSHLKKAIKHIHFPCICLLCSHRCLELYKCLAHRDQSLRCRLFFSTINFNDEKLRAYAHLQNYVSQQLPVQKSAS